MSSNGCILDPRVKLLPNNTLLALIDQHKDSIIELPENISRALKSHGYSVPSKIEILKTETPGEPIKVDVKLLRDLVGDLSADDTTEQINQPKAKTTNENVEQGTDKLTASEVYLHLSDLKWLNSLLTQLRMEQKTDVYLHNIIEQCTLQLPQNEVLERNPELEARCQKLREEQQNQAYRKMTKNVDSTLKNFPEDTISYQIKAMNSQIIAVLQFIFSVAAGFVFGFLGIELMIGNLDFGFRLLLGIMCALIIALAEIYFLAKKLNEYDDMAAASSHLPPSPTKKKTKVHAD